MELCSDAYRFRSPQRCVQKDVDTSDTEALTVTWSSLGLTVAPNYFLRTDTTNDDTMIVFSTCGIPFSNFFLMHVCERNVHHIYQFPDCLVAVALAITLVISRMLLAITSRR